MRLRMATKISASIFGVILLALVNGFVGLWVAWYLTRLWEATVQEHMASVRATEEVEIALLEQKDYVSLYIHDQGNRTWLEVLANKEPAFTQWLAQVHQSAHTTEEREVLARLEEAYASYVQTRREVVAAFDRQEREKAMDLLLHVLPRSFERVYGHCEDLIAANERGIQAANDRSRQQVQWLTVALGSSFALTLGAGGGLFWLFLRGVVRPLRQMASDVRLFHDREAGSIRGFPDDELELRAVGHYFQALMSDMVATRSHLEQSQLQLTHAEKLASVGKLAASVAHEIRNPLTAVKMWLFTIRTAVGEDVDVQSKFVIISDEIGRLEAIIHSFLEFSRPPLVQRGPYDAAVLIQRTAELMRPRLREKMCDLHYRFEPGLPAVLADAEQLKQVFLNLMSNAIDACPHQGRIEVSTALAAGTNETTVVVRIHDNGPGMPPDVRERIFEPFFTTKSDGSGLGLCIAASIMHRHEGRCILEESGASGTTFAVWIPVARN